MQSIFNVELVERNSVIIFDEIQLNPKARQAIKHFVEDGRYDYIETGSLISIRRNVKDILIPSEERRLQMNPMDFEEFLMAIGKENQFNFLKKFFEQKLPLAQAHQKMMRDFKLYMLIGGMPQAVQEYIDTNNFNKVDIVKRDILNLYEEDFRKIDYTGNMSMILNAIPSELEKKEQIFKYHPY